ncbi:hypothetical protein V1527DRAFT_474257 [Lipomyces starkeyi]
MLWQKFFRRRSINCAAEKNIVMNCRAMFNSMTEFESHWVELFVRKRVNFGIITTLRVEGSHAALKGVLTLSSGTLFTAGKKNNQQRTPPSSNEQHVIVKIKTAARAETAALVTTISRSALDLIHAEVMKKLHGQESARS